MCRPDRVCGWGSRGDHMKEVARLQGFLRASASTGRSVVSIPPFTAFLDPADPLTFLNYAIPDDDVTPSRDQVSVLRRVFRDQDRLPRLEWIEEVAPRVERALAESGMTEELRAPLMACRLVELVTAAANVPDLVVRPVGDDDLRECATLQRVAFGQPPVVDGEPVHDPRTHGGGALLARAAGQPVSAAAWTPVIDGVSEIAGVATAESWRGRGLAGMITAEAARMAFAAGAELCVLSPGGERAQRVYRRAGFHRIATMLHWSDPQ